MSIGAISLSNDATIALIGTYVEYLRKNKKIRTFFLITQLLSLILLGSFRLFSSFLFDASLLETAHEWQLILIVVVIISLLTTLISFTDIKFNQGNLIIELNGLRKEREEIKKKISQGHDDIFNTIQLSLNQLTEYYTINLSQARTSYRWSITAILVGILTLLAGIWLVYFDTNPKLDLALISGVSGVIIEFIGASNLYIYNKSLKQLNLYFQELIRVQDTMLAIELCEKIQDDAKKTEVKEKIIINLMKRSSLKSSELKN